MDFHGRMVCVDDTTAKNDSRFFAFSLDGIQPSPLIMTSIRIENFEIVDIR